MIEEVKSLIHALVQPDGDILELWRTGNVIFAAGVFVGMLIFGGSRWRTWTVKLRLGYLSLTVFIFTAFYGTFEVLYLTTMFRVPMVTAALAWAVLSALYPDDKAK